MPTLALLMIPFVQLGITYYASAATAITVLCILSFSGQMVPKSFKFFGFCVAIACAMMASILVYPDHFGDDFTRIGREVVFFLLIAFSAHGFQDRPPLSPAATASLLKIITLISGFFFAIAIVQIAFFARRSYFGLPLAWFIQNQDTIPRALDLYYSRLRPFGTFGEPSYFSFILISLLLPTIPIARKLMSEDRDARAGQGRAIFTTIFVIIFTGILTRSLSFFLASTVICYFAFAKSTSASARRWILAGVVAFIIFSLATGSASDIFTRSTSASGDKSIVSRIFAPISMIGDYLASYPFGMPYSRLLEALGPFAAEIGQRANSITHNASFNAVFSYGIVGFLIVPTTIFASRDPVVRVYLLACTSFNGAFYAVDKMGVICLTLAIYESCKRMVRLASAAQNPIQPLAPSTEGLAQSASPFRAG